MLVQYKITTDGDDAQLSYNVEKDLLEFTCDIPRKKSITISITLKDLQDKIWAIKDERAVLCEILKHNIADKECYITKIYGSLCDNTYNQHIIEHERINVIVEKYIKNGTIDASWSDEICGFHRRLYKIAPSYIEIVRGYLTEN